jgi:hypothetical protein
MDVRRNWPHRRHLHMGTVIESLTESDPVEADIIQIDPIIIPRSEGKPTNKNIL